MIHLKVSAQWTTQDGQNLDIDERLLRILKAIDEFGSLSLACKAIGISYRTLWAQIQFWNKQLERDLVKTQGRAGACLTEFGFKLMWMFEQGAARLNNETSATSDQLNSEWSEQSLNRPWISMSLSDDPLLQQLLQTTSLYDDLDVSLRWSNSISAMSALHRGEVKLAGCHLPVVGHENNEAFKIMRKWLRGENLSIIDLYSREVGWIYRKAVRPPTLTDVAHNKALLVNHSPASTTYHQLNGLLRQMGFTPEKMPGYFHEENSHLAVACSIAAKQGDLALGVRDAADTYKLGFQPVCEERYFFVFNNNDWDFPALTVLKNWLKTKQVKQKIARMQGYQSDRLGEIISLEDLLNELSGVTPRLKTQPIQA